MKERPYKFLPHTADAKFQARGKTLVEAFKNAAYAMTDVMTDHKKVKAVKEKTIKVGSENPEALLYDFLEQFLILVDAKGFILSKIKEIKIIEDKQKFRIQAKVLGDSYKNYDIKTHIKAVTYQQMFIKKDKKGYVVQVIVDI